MSWVSSIHGGCVHPRRVRVLSEHFARLIPPESSVLDVGCGDGQLAAQIERRRPDLKFKGLDVLLRPNPGIPVTPFDGSTIPFASLSFDVVMFADVLHHTPDPTVLLREAARVARRCIVIKDHLLKGALAASTLRFMDRVGNKRHGVALPYNYWRHDQWMAAFNQLKLEVRQWHEKLGLYPFPANVLFDRSLHFIAELSLSQ
ncbi:MAG TPA: class I SAM-dependent methyltransferase [Verrucomicrobiae bacterium]|nr:class I SAM-dependent methyltransferase [Verrucomicrobiae bacterium]